MIIKRILDYCRNYHFSFLRAISKKEKIVVIITIVISVFYIAFLSICNNKHNDYQTLTDGEIVTLLIIKKARIPIAPQIYSYNLYYVIDNDSSATILDTEVKCGLFDKIKPGDRIKAIQKKGGNDVYPIWDSICPPQNQ